MALNAPTYLCQDKAEKRAKALVAELDSIIAQDKMGAGDLETTVGRVGFIAGLVPGGRRLLVPVRAAAMKGVKRLRADKKEVTVSVGGDVRAALTNLVLLIRRGACAAPVQQTGFLGPLDEDYEWISVDGAREKDLTAGIGGFWRGFYFYVPFNVLEECAKYMSIGAVEAWAVVVGIMVFGKHIRGKWTDMFIDNAAAQLLVNKGYSSNRQMAVCGEAMAMECAEVGVETRGIGVASADNVLADAASRGVLSDKLGGLAGEARKVEHGAWTKLVRLEVPPRALELARKLATVGREMFPDGIPLGR